MIVFGTHFGGHSTKNGIFLYRVFFSDSRRGRFLLFTTNRMELQNGIFAREGGRWEYSRGGLGVFFFSSSFRVDGISNGVY